MSRTKLLLISPGYSTGCEYPIPVILLRCFGAPGIAVPGHTILCSTTSAGSNAQILSSSQHQPYYLRPGYRFKTNLQVQQQNILDLSDGPGRRLRKNVTNVRRHIDYISNVLNHFEVCSLFFRSTKNLF
ncbi:unnamed protein product [Gongylonema pulchrum]|uniref:Uncharacterized protein n=1 Tax=Gongylonema pulchrum TaxID=637853 RepID=A0A183EPT8_9BILA|nr:unnamed protein product [Gongylonema pulchrum]